MVVARSGFLVHHEGVLVEASHLLRKTPSAVARVVQFVAALRCAVVPLSPSRLARAVEIVEAHHSLRLDLVDAVLCALSEELKIDELASLDRRDSLAVQRPGRPRFLVNPLASPLDPMTLMTSLADAERDLALK